MHQSGTWTNQRGSFGSTWAAQEPLEWPAEWMIECKHVCLNACVVCHQILHIHIHFLFVSMFSGPSWDATQYNMVFWDFSWNLGWHVSNAAGRHCSHGCSLSTDSLLSRPVSRPATHSSWVGEWEKLDPPDTGYIMFGQCCDTTGGGTQHLTFASRVFWFHFFRAEHIGFRLVIGDGCGHVLFADTPIAYNRCVTAQRCSRIPGGHWVLVTCRKSGLAHMQISCPPALTNQRDLALIYSHISSSHFDLMSEERTTQSHQV